VKETTMSRKRYIDIPDHARRDFIKWTVGLGAALGLRPWKVFEVQESVVGPAVAQSAQCSPVNRFVGFVAGNGGLAWVTQLWPYPQQATTAGAAFYAIGKATQQTVGTGDHAMPLAPDAPKWQGKMTGFIAGTNETHTTRPVSSSTVATGVGMFAAAAALQTASPTLVPAIGIGQLPYGTAAGAPALAAVPNPAGMVGLFNSAASSAGGALVKAQDAALFEAYYKANLSLHRAAQLPTFTTGYLTGKVASNLIGKNLASQLQPTTDDLTRYGLNGAAAKLSSIGTTLITTAKAFKLNLTNSVLMPFMLDDPHGAFADMAGTTATIQSLGKMLGAFMDDLNAIDDPMCAGRKIGDNTVMAFVGDTHKNPFQPSGWPDGTTANSSAVWVYGAGQLRGGWFGQALSNGTIETWNPSTGAEVAGGSSAAMAGPAGGAVLYAVAKGDMRRVQDFYRGAALDGVIVPKQM
jgi:hypothetical protein